MSKNHEISRRGVPDGRPTCVCVCKHTTTPTNLLNWSFGRYARADDRPIDLQQNAAKTAAAELKRD